MVREIKCKVSQHGVRNLKWGVFGAMNDVLMPQLRDLGMNPTRISWSAERVEYPPDADGRVDVLYEVRGKEVI